MFTTALLLLLAAVAYSAVAAIVSLRSNIAKAKQTGFPYFVTPVCPFSAYAQLTHGLWVPLFKRLPRKYWGEIEDVLDRLNWRYSANHEPFARIGDTFAIVSPYKLLLFTDNAEVIYQVTAKREAFPKPTSQYKILNLYGDNILTTEGPQWRTHRRITAASFNEKNAALVFKETIAQTQGLVKQWLSPQDQSSGTIKTLEHDTMSLTLNIISYVGFGLRLIWPGQSLPPSLDAKLAKYAAPTHVPSNVGHTMSFAESVKYTLENIFLLMILPQWLRKILPSKTVKFAEDSEANYVTYMREFLADKIDDVRQGNQDEGMDIMGSLVKTSYGDQAPSESKRVPAEKSAKMARLSDEEIIGNAFIMIVAGHETTANTVHFALAHLAINPAAQRLVQKDVDDILGNAPAAEWDYEAKISTLQASMVAACVNEVLRLMPPVIGVPKVVSPDQDQYLVIDGEKHWVPRDMQIDLTIAAVQRNPRYWPTKPSQVSGKPHDLDDFEPSRWFQTNKLAHGEDKAVDGADTEDFGGFAGPDTSSALFRPARGSFIPFSDGARSCLGRRIALVELLAAISVVMQKYSIELAVDEWADDAAVEAMSREERAALYRKAITSSQATIGTAASRLTLKLHNGRHIPVRVVRRGEERFVNWFE